MKKKHPFNGLSSESDRVWLTALATGLVFTLIAAYGYPYPAHVSGKFWAYAGLFIRASLFLWAGESLKGRGGEVLRALFNFGLVAGIFELLVDWVLIHGVATGRLVYLTGNDVVLLGSPIWMPLAWACIITELGYLTIRLYTLLRPRCSERVAAAVASVMGAATAGVTVGFYEYFAYLAGWWKYEPAKVMIGPYCAVFIPLGEALMFSSIMPIAARALSDEDRPVVAALRGGISFAVAIAAGYAVAYLLLER